MTFAVGPTRVHADQVSRPATGTRPGVLAGWVNERGELQLIFSFDAPATMDDSARYMGTVCKRLP